MTWLTWLPRLLWLGLWFAKVLMVSNLTVIGDNVTPGQSSRPGIVQLPTRCRTEFEVTLLSVMISLTPGTLTLAHRIMDGTRVIFVHGMYSDGPDHQRASLRDMERHMLASLRREGFTP